MNCFVNSGFNENILHLYHGTTANLDHVCDEGLDERLSRKGRFGKGIYFRHDFDIFIF